MVVSRSVAANAKLIEALSQRQVKRVYQALVQGTLVSGGTVDAPIGRNRQARTRMQVADGGKPAVTHYRVVRRFKNYTQIEARLESGRTHQIRVHMAHIGHPLVGDPTYGGRPRFPAGAGQSLIAALSSFRRQALHACELGLFHPTTGEQLSWRVQMPVDLTCLLEQLNADPGQSACN